MILTRRSQHRMHRALGILVIAFFFCSQGWQQGIFPFGVEAAVTSTPPDHIVFVIMSSREYTEVIGNPDAPFINGLIQRGVIFSDYHGMDSHFTQPNYLSLFSGSSQRVTSDVFPPNGFPFNATNIYSVMNTAGISFVHQAESLPSAGSTDAGSYPYAAYHNAAASFGNITRTINVPFNEALFIGTSFPNLPAVTFVIPNLDNDMSNASNIFEADRWLRNKFGDYIDYAALHHSLFILTWDCDITAVGTDSQNRVAAILVGGMVKPNQIISKPRLNHLSLLQTILRMFRLPQIGASGSAVAFPTSTWTSSYALPPISVPSSSHPSSTKPSGPRGIVVFIIVIFSLAGFLLAGFFSVMFYRKWKKSKLEFIGTRTATELPTQI